MNTYYAPDAVRSFPCALPDFIVRAAFLGRCHYYPCFTDEKSEVERGWDNFPKATPLKSGRSLILSTVSPQDALPRWGRSLVKSNVISDLLEPRQAGHLGSKMI